MVTYFLEEGTVEPEKRPLLANGYEKTFVSGQRFGKHVLVSTYTHATIDVLYGTMFSTRSVQRRYRKDNWGN
jgi:hypothetical protein